MNVRDSGAGRLSEGGRLVNFPAAHVFRPPRSSGQAIGAGIAGVAILLGVALLVRGALRGVSFASFAGDVIAVALLAIGALFAYWTFALYNLRYAVDDDSLVIVWGLTGQIVPVDQIERIVLGRKFGEPLVRGLSWPGCHVGPARVARVGAVLLYSTHRSVQDLVYVVTPQATFGLSLSDAHGLARAVQAAQENLRTAAGPAVAAHYAPPGQSVLLDRRALTLAGGALLAFLVAAGYVFSRYQALPLSLPLPYPPTAGAARIGERIELLRLPLTALLWLLIGFGIAAWAHPRLRAASYSILAGTIFAECLYAIGALAAAH